MSDRNLTLSRSGAADTARVPARRSVRPEPAAASTSQPVVVSPPLAAELPLHAHPGSSAGVDLQVHGELADVEQEWRAFEAHAERTAFQSFAWLAKWQRHIGSRTGAQPVIVFGRDQHGNLLFILPLAIEKRGPLRCLTWLGSDLCDYNAPLLAEHFSETLSRPEFVRLWRGILKRLRSDRRFRFDLVDLQKLPESVGKQRNPFLRLKVRRNPSSAYLANLPSDWEGFYGEKRSGSTRKRERRQLRQLAELGEVRFDEPLKADEIAYTLEMLIAQKSRAFARMGAENIFGRPGYRDFFLDLATDLNVRALTHMSRFDVGTVTAATSLGLRFRDSYYLVLSSYLDGELSRFGPGRAHLHELLRHAIEQGFQKFDFTIGDEPYKRDWSDRELHLYDHLAAVTLRGRAAAAVILLFRRIKRLIKQTPIVWHSYLKLRALVGSFRGWLARRAQRA
jgi:CelD/BcsL family acetyltransferase involved in cellulose biosynthesis